MINSINIITINIVNANMFTNISIDESPIELFNQISSATWRIDILANIALCRYHSRNMNAAMNIMRDIPATNILFE